MTEQCVVDVNRIKPCTNLERAILQNLAGFKFETRINFNHLSRRMVLVVEKSSKNKLQLSYCPACGANWKSAIQRDLGLNHHQRIVQWVNGDRPIPPIENELINILQSRKAAIESAISQLINESKPMNTPKVKSLDAIKTANPDADEYELMQAWIAENPMPEITDLQDFKQAVNKAVWAFESGVAVAYFNDCLEIEVSGYRWAIEQAIINRDGAQTMLQAGLEWVENRLQTI